jgi:dihydrofolate synthase / folylpolyglutamate synthase
MQITPLKTRTLVPPQDDLFAALVEILPRLEEASVIALSSKAVAIDEGRCVPLSQETDAHELKERLIREEADLFVPRMHGERRRFTILHGTLAGSSGIDESNGNGHLILWPEDPMAAARAWHARLARHYGISRLAVIVTDSHSIPLHNGALGIAIGYAGFLPLKDYRDTEDLFGRPFRVERMNIADSLAAAATFAMGEGDESTPVVLMRDVPHITYTDEEPKDPRLTLTVPLEEDSFRPFLDNGRWQKGGGGAKF